MSTPRSWIFVLLFCFPLCLPAFGQGDDRGVAEILIDDPSLSPETRAALEKLLAEKPGGGWVEGLKFSGDLRLRHESTVERDDLRDRHRERLRLRLVASYVVSDDLVLGTRLVTGSSGDPNSTHITLGDGLDSLEVTLDRLYARYTPELLEGSAVTAGKFGHPFVSNPIYGELVWDADVQPEGVVGTYGTGAGSTRFDVTAGYYLLVEQDDATDVSLPVIQASTRLEGEETDAVFALGYYHYTNNTPDGDMTLSADNAGNQVAIGEFVHEFGVIDAIASVGTSLADRPVTFAGQWFKNTRTGDRSQGWAVGGSLGTTREPGDWSTYYQWQVVEQESVFSPFAQDDFIFATNHRSHIFGVKYRCTSDLRVHLWSLVSRRDHTSPGPTTDSDKDQWRIRLDVDIAF